MIEIMNIAVSWALMVLIWLVQIIIYPSFQSIPEAKFPEYHRWYALRISFFVVPLMLWEIVALTLFGSISSWSVISLVSLLLVGIVWLSTFFVQVPIHRKINTEKNDRLIRKLVSTNWMRTTAWTIKAVLLTMLLV